MGGQGLCARGTGHNCCYWEYSRMRGADRLGEGEKPTLKPAKLGAAADPDPSRVSGLCPMVAWGCGCCAHQHCPLAFGFHLPICKQFMVQGNRAHTQSGPALGPSYLLFFTHCDSFQEHFCHQIVPWPC